MLEHFVLLIRLDKRDAFVNAELNIVTADVVGEDMTPRPMQGSGPVISIQVATQNEATSLKKVFYVFCDHIVTLKWFN